jgi:citrate synthase
MNCRDSDRGLLLFRGYSLEQLWGSDFEDMLHLMVWVKYPTPLQKESLRQALVTAMLDIPESVVAAVHALP